MPAPNIEMIADSLRNCTLSGGRRRGVVGSPAVRSPPSPARSDEEEEEEEVTVELNSDVTLPYHWEQCLDMRTGQVYYINWVTGIRTNEDPRLNNAYSSDDDGNEGESSDEDDDTSDSSNRENYRDKYFNSDVSNRDSTSTSSSSAYSPEVTSTDTQVLVAAGCKYCFMYFMVPKHDFGCPKCGRRLLHLSHSDDDTAC